MDKVIFVVCTEILGNNNTNRLSLSLRRGGRTGPGRETSDVRGKDVTPPPRSD